MLPGPMKRPTGTVSFLFTDVEGSTRLWETARDAMEANLARHDAIVRNAIESHDGYVFSTGGDAFSAAFQSLSDAFDAAISAQRLLVAEPWRGAQIRVRMAIHVGQAEERDGDYFGSTLNRTARLLSTSEGSEILLSGAAAGVAADLLPLGSSLVDLGERTLKDLERPERVFRLEAPGVQQHSTGSAVTVAEGTAFAPSDRRQRSIAVLPFEVIGGDEDTRTLADGLAEDVITALSAFRHFPVTARNSSFVYRDQAVDIRRVSEELQVRFVLEGSVRQIGSRIRVTAQLIDGRSGTHVWADRYDGEITDVFELQDHMTANVASAIDPAIVASEAKRLATTPPSSFDAWDHLVRGRSLVEALEPAQVEEGIRHLEEALALDPGSAIAHVWLATARFTRAWAGWVDDPEAEFELAMEAAQRAIALDPQQHGGHVLEGAIHMFRRKLDRARAAAVRALRLNPSAWEAHMIVGNVEMYRGDPEAGARSLTRSLELSPFGFWSAMTHAPAALCHYLMGDYDLAVDHGRQAVAQRSGYVFGLVVLTASLARAGMADEARAALAEVFHFSPDFQVGSLNQPLQPDQLEVLTQGLQLAGLGA